jgi:hypothetical protein
MAHRSVGRPVEAGIGFEMEVSTKIANGEFFHHLGGPHSRAMTVVLVTPSYAVATHLRAMTICMVDE